MEKIQINNFAGLKDVEIEIRPVTGFIGPETSGKSIIAKLIYFFRGIASRLLDAAYAGQNSVQYNVECLRRFNRYFPPDVTAGTPDFHITYTSGSEHVSVDFSADQGRPRSRRLDLSGFYQSAVEKFGREADELQSRLFETLDAAGGRRGHRRVGGMAPGIHRGSHGGDGTMVHIRSGFHTCWPRLFLPVRRQRLHCAQV